MKKSAFLASMMVVCYASQVQADLYTTRCDPSGAPMCFGQAGEKAALSLCADAQTTVYWLRHDPSGAPMCFDSQNHKAALSHCRTHIARVDPSVLISRNDPSGAPMCFDTAGGKVALARCLSARMSTLASDTPAPPRK